MPRWRRLPPSTSSRRWRRWRAPSRKKFSARCSPRRGSTAPMSTMAATSRCILPAASSFTVGLMDRPDAAGLMRTMVIDADDPARGIATSGRHGRSFSLGIADAVTVLARTASQADAAATIIANAVDLPGHPAIVRCPAQRVAARQRPRRAPGHPRCRRVVGRARSTTRWRPAVGARAAIACGGIDRRRGLASAGRDGRGGCNRDASRRRVAGVSRDMRQRALMHV